MHSACQRATSSRRMRQLCGFITRAAHRTRHTHRPESSSGRPDRRRGRGRTPADSRRERRPRNGASPRLLAGHPPGGGHTRGLVRVMGLREGLDCVPPVWPEGPEGSSLRALTLWAPPVGTGRPDFSRPRQSASFRLSSAPRWSGPPVPSPESLGASRGRGHLNLVGITGASVVTAFRLPPDSKTRSPAMPICGLSRGINRSWDHTLS